MIREWISSSKKNFMRPIGASHLGYLPLQEVDVNQVVPSEIDDYYRHSEIQGFVHDMGAAMQNGVGGHAGLFSNANDVAKMMQMFMQGGSYGGRNYFSSSTVSHFNTRHYKNENNRRGIGFDKQQFEDPGPNLFVCIRSEFWSFGLYRNFCLGRPSVMTWFMYFYPTVLIPQWKTRNW